MTNEKKMMTARELKELWLNSETDYIHPKDFKTFEQEYFASFDEPVMEEAPEPSPPISISLQDLVGEHMLSGVDTATISKTTWGSGMEDCNVINFILDGVTYSAIEDPSDGYRSSMEEIRIVTDVKVKNVFEPIKVIAEYVAEDVNRYRGHACDILELYDASNKLKVLEVGTDNSDDYYPSFVASFSPENMSLNAAPKPKSKNLDMKTLKVTTTAAEESPPPIIKERAGYGDFA